MAESVSSHTSAWIVEIPTMSIFHLAGNGMRTSLDVFTVFYMRTTSCLAMRNNGTSEKYIWNAFMFDEF